MTNPKGQPDKEIIQPDWNASAGVLEMPDPDFYNYEDDGRWTTCCHCSGQGFLYGDLGRICPDCDGSGYS